MRSMPYYMTNEEWFFFDPRVFRHRLTDKVTEKALDSYLEYYSNGYGAMEYKSLVEQTKKDIEDYTKNKERYTFTKNDLGVYYLTAIDGKRVDCFSEN